MSYRLFGRLFFFNADSLLKNIFFCRCKWDRKGPSPSPEVHFSGTTAIDVVGVFNRWDRTCFAQTATFYGQYFPTDVRPSTKVWKTLTVLVTYTSV